MLPVKSNIGALAPGLGFQATTEAGIVASHVVWDSAPVTLTANHALHAAAQDATKSSSIREAEEFLREALAEGPMDVAQVEGRASEASISKATLRRARTRLNVATFKDGYQGTWRMKLPTEEQQQ